jgi:hypothetical protein
MDMDEKISHLLSGVGVLWMFGGLAMQPRDVLEGWEDLKEALSLTQGGAVFFVVADDKGDARIKERLRGAGWDPVEEEIAVWLDPSSGKPAYRMPEYDALQRQLAGCRNAVLWLRLRGIEAAGHEEIFPDRPVTSETSEELARLARQVLQGINLSREPLAELGVPIVFSLTEDGLRSFAAWAADMFAARTLIVWGG